MIDIDINDLQRLQDSFSKSELREIDRVIKPLDRALRSSARAFKALGDPVATDVPELSTMFLVALEPARLASARMHLQALREFFRREWQKNHSQRARVLSCAVHDMTTAIVAIDHRLSELEPVMREQEALMDRIERALQRIAARRKVA